MKKLQDRIDQNTVHDIENDKAFMIDYLADKTKCSDTDLIHLQRHYEYLTELNLLKIESAVWLILIYKERYKRENRGAYLLKTKSDYGREF